MTDDRRNGRWYDDMLYLVRRVVDCGSTEVPNVQVDLVTGKRRNWLSATAVQLLHLLLN